MNTLPDQFEWSIEQNVLCIVDLNQGGPSVTNAAEAVLHFIFNSMADQRRFNALAAIIYRDSLLSWDGIRLDSSGNVSFYTLGVKNKQDAIQMALLSSNAVSTL